jgi:hypothetical protein
MSTIKAAEAQFGHSPDNLDNFTLSATGQGIFNLYNGSAGFSNGNVLSVQSTNNITATNDISIASKLDVPTASLSKTGNNVANVAYVNNAINQYCKYVVPVANYKQIATNGGHYAGMVFDSVGNLFIAVANYTDGTIYNVTSYIYKMTPDGTITQFASVVGNGAYNTALAIDTADNLYWAITNVSNGATYNTTSYLYKVTSGGTLTTLNSITTNRPYGTALLLVGTNLYWAVTNNYNGTTYTQTSYVYKYDILNSTFTTFASTTTLGASFTSLIKDSSNNIYWSVANTYSGSSYSITSYVYKITPAGSLSIFSSTATIGSIGSALAIDENDNVYWAVANQFDGVSYTQQSFVYKITSAGVQSTIASKLATGATGTSLVFDSAGNLYWAIALSNNGTTSNRISYIYRIESTGETTTVFNISTNGVSQLPMIVDFNDNVFVFAPNYYNDSVYTLNSTLNVLYAHNYTA